MDPAASSERAEKRARHRAHAGMRSLSRPLWGLRPEVANGLFCFIIGILLYKNVEYFSLDYYYTIMDHPPVQECF